MIRGVLVYGERGGLQDRLEKRFYEERIPLIQHTIVDFSWKRRLEATMEIADFYSQDTLIFLDAWDTMFLGDSMELHGLHLDDGVTFAAQKFCWPDKSREDEYDDIQGLCRFKGAPVIPDGIGPWRFLCSNPMAGLGQRIADALYWGWSRFPMKTNTNSTEEYDVDERFHTNLYLSEARKMFNIKLDTQCRMNQNFLASVPGDLWLEDGRITNVIHGTKPVFVHFNGRSEVPEELL